MIYKYMLIDNKKKMACVIFNIINLSILAILLYFTSVTYKEYNFIENWAYTVSIMAIFLFCIQLLQFYVGNIKFSDFKIWFLILTYLFMFGRVFLYAFDPEAKVFWNLMVRYPDDLLYKTSLYILCYIQSIFTGLMFFLNKHSTKEKKFLQGKSSAEIDYLLYTSGLILCFVSFPFKLYIDINSMISAQSSGSYLSLTGQSGIFDDISFLFVPSILAIIIGTNKKRKLPTALMIITILYFVMTMITTGDRRYPVTGMISILLCYVVVKNVKFSFVKIISIVGVSWVFLNILTIIRNIRADNLVSISEFISSYGSQLFSLEIIYETAAEFGISFFSVVEIIRNIPSTVPFVYGISFIGSFTSLLPIGFMFGEFYKKVSISKTINEIAGYPVGSSFPGDLYANFGYFSFLAAILFGILLSKIFYTSNADAKNFRYFQYYSLFYILINLVRSSFFEIFRSSFIVYFLPMIIVMLLSKRLSQKSENLSEEKTSPVE